MCLEVEVQLLLRNVWELESLKKGKYSVTGLKGAKEKQRLSQPVQDTWIRMERDT